MRQLLLVFPVLAVACGAPHDRALDIKTEAPSGKFAGAGWSMTKASVSKSGDSLSVHLFADATVADCASSSDKPFILFTVPAKVGKRTLQLSLTDFFSPDNQTVTFVTPPSDNNISTDGIINTTALSETSVTMGLLAKAGTGNEVNGTFTTMLCP